MNRITPPIGVHTVLHAQAAGGNIRLLHPHREDFESWTALRRVNEAYLKPWEPGEGAGKLTRADYRAKLLRLKRLAQMDRAFAFHVFRDHPDTLIGACNITHVERGAVQSAKLGYWIGQDYIRQGFARAAVGVVSEFCFKQLGLHRVEAAVQSHNKASIRVLEACGYQREGSARGFLRVNGSWQDHDIYARLSTDK